MRLFPVSAVLLVAVGACHSGPTEPAGVASLSIDPSSASVPRGAALHLLVLARDSHGAIIGRPELTFQTSAPLTATVDNAGIVTGLRVGPVTITAMSGQQAVTASIQVSPRPAEALGLGANYACALTETARRIAGGETTKASSAMERGWGRMSPFPAPARSSSNRC